ncbi:MAG: winged helix-turn-helix domain-containing protein [Aliiglaciecola sp.]
MLIGGWQVDESKNQLLKDEAVITLRNKVMAVLIYLAKHSHRLVSRDELIDAIWLGNEPVGKKGLTNAIWQLRSDLQQIDMQSDAILTVPKKGYQLLLTVSDEQVGKVSVQQEKHATPEEFFDAPLKKRLVPTVLFAAIMLLAIGSYYFLHDSHTQFNEFAANSAVNQLNVKGTEVFSAISPGGEHFAYSKFAQGQYDIYLRELTINPSSSQAVEIKLTNNPDPESHIRFSPDGKYITFIRGRGRSRCGIYILNVETAQNQLVTQCTDTLLSKVAWSNNDNELLVFDKRPQQNIGGLYKVNVSSGERSLLPIPFSTRLYLDGQSAFSNDGSKIAFVRSPSTNAQDVFVYDIASQQTTRMTYDNAKIFGIRWLQDNQTIVFASTRAGQSGLWRQNLQDKLPTALDILGRNLSISANESILLIENVNSIQNILSVDVTDPKSEPVPLNDQQTPNSEPVFSEANNHIDYAQYVNNQAAFFRLDINDNINIPYQFPENYSDVSQAVTSPNGKFVAFVALQAGHQFRHVFRMSVEGKQVLQVSQGAGDHFVPSWSPDGKAVYAATAITGRWEIWKYSLDSVTPPSQETFNGGGIIQHRNGNRFISKADRDGIWQLDGNKNDHLLVGSLQQKDWGNWYAADKGIYYIMRDSLQDRVMFYTYATQSAQTIVQYPSGTVAIGKNLVFNEHNQRLYLTVNVVNETEVVALFDS